MSTSHMNPGAILAGRWQVQDFIGSGETAEVYGVRDMHSTGTFALKLFWPNALAQPEIWSALQQTARTASGLGVDGVARAYDFGIDANSGRPFFVSERVSWSALSDRVKLRGPLTPAEMSGALGVLARALDAAHRVGLVHRDLKPENVFISPENANWVRISDFGVALIRSASPPPPGWGGTVGWVAPDGADPNARSTPAMDVFALGLVTFFALSGGHLHRAARATPIDPGALWQELSAPLDSAAARARELGASLDPAFDAWFQRAVAPNPALRFTSVGEMASTFEAIARTLFAPQSQNAVALHGVAAAIAQPLIFQPESLPPAAAPAAAPAPAPAEVPTAVSAQYAPDAGSAPSSSIPGVKKKTAAPLFIAGAVVCFSLFALGAYGLYRHRSAAAEGATAEAAASASAALAAAPVAAAPPPVAPVAVPSPTAASSVAAAEPTAPAPALASASAEPRAGALAASPAPAKAAAAFAAPKPASAAPTQAAAKPAAVASVKPAAAAAAKPAAVTASTKPAAAATAKPAAVAAAPKPKAAASATLPKKKCGSVFIPCK